MSWFQLGVAYGDLGQSAQAINAYEKALALNPDYDLAMFNLGGTHWNRGEKSAALAIWKMAIARFPDHELTAKLRREIDRKSVVEGTSVFVRVAIGGSRVNTKKKHHQ